MRTLVMHTGLCALMLASLLGCAPAAAHTSSTGLAAIDARTANLKYQLTIVPSELGDSAADISQAAAGDAASAERVAQWLGSLIQVSVDGSDCSVTRTRIQSSQAADARVLLSLDFACANPPGRLRLKERLSERFGEHYRTIVSVVRGDGQREERVFDSDHAEAVFDLARPALSGFLQFLRLGAQHMLGGLDHLLFLAALLAGSRRLRELLIVITMFTLAHSISLSLAALGFGSLPPVLVEPLIAASIVWVAIENVWFKAAAARRFGLAFAFGLVHGLAFAEVLTPLRLSGWPLFRALFGFNFGVELAQALVVVILAPAIAWAVRSRRQRWLQMASMAIGAIGVIWLFQRLIFP